MSAAPERAVALDELRRRGAEVASLSLRECFAADPSRATNLTFDAAGLHLDLSKQLVRSADLEALLHLASASGLETQRDALLAGEVVNESEGRAALHVRERAQGARGLDPLRRFVEALRKGDVLGATNQPLRVVVNLGIGGSDLGPRMAHAALANADDGTIEVRFASSLDPSGLAAVLEGLSAEHVLFVAATKSFSTLETGVLAHRAVEWLRSELGNDADVTRHLAAVTARADLAQRAGIAPERTFTIDEGIGGRFSLSSAMGLSLMAAIGTRNFDELLAGFEDLDLHFATAPLEMNLPVLHGLIGFWNRSILGFGAQAVVPYSWDLRLLPEHLQQLVMESNGKSVDRAGQPIALSTSPVLFGAPGTEAQHSFFQLLHQGTDRVPVDLIGVARGPEGPQDRMMANLLAQAQALAFGESAEELEAAGIAHHLAAVKAMPGNRPSTFLGLVELSPRSLGALVALYEHSVFVQAVLWDLNPFDQFGVELSKVLAGPLAEQLHAGVNPEVSLDGSTSALIEWFRAAQS